VVRNLAEIQVEVKVWGQPESKVVKLSQGSSILDLLEKLGQNPQVVAVKLNGRIVPEQEKLADGDQVELIPVVTGG